MCSGGLAWSAAIQLAQELITEVGRHFEHWRAAERLVRRGVQLNAGRSWSGHVNGRHCSHGVVLAHTDVSVSQHWEMFTSQSLWPLEAKLVHEGLAAVLCPLANGAAWRDGFLQNRAHWRIHGAQEELEFRRALYLDQRVKLVYFQPSILLVVVSNQIWHYGLVVSDVSAQGDGYGLTEAVVGNGYPTVSVILSRRHETARQHQCQKQTQTSTRLHCPIKFRQTFTEHNGSPQTTLLATCYLLIENKKSRELV